MVAASISSMNEITSIGFVRVSRVYLTPPPFSDSSTSFMHSPPYSRTNEYYAIIFAINTCTFGTRYGRNRRTGPKTTTLREKCYSIHIYVYKIGRPSWRINVVIRRLIIIIVINITDRISRKFLIYTRIVRLFFTPVLSARLRCRYQLPSLPKAR